MDIGNWTDLLTRFGGQTATIIALVWFLWRGVWPVILQRLDTSEAAREREFERFGAALKQTNEIHAAAVKQIVEALQALREEVIRSR